MMPAMIPEDEAAAVETGSAADDGAEAEAWDALALARLASHLTAELARTCAKRLAPGLHVVATPIGNLADISIRALGVMARASAVLCEDTRHTRTLVAHYGLSPRLLPYHDHNAGMMRPKVLAMLAAGQSVALVSDAGTPLVSDPGLKLVRAALEAGHAVTSLPGASAVVTALTLAGLATDTFLFAGFLPPRSGARRTRLGALAQVPATLVFFETGPRLAEALADMAAVLGSRPAAIARELTKLHEDVERGSLGALAARHGAAATPVRGEIVVLVGPGEVLVATDADIRAQLASVLQVESLRDAARIVAEDLQVARARVYDLALSLKREGRS